MDIRLQANVDATSVALFADEGSVVLTDQIFPKPSSRGLRVFASGGSLAGQARCVRAPAIARTTFCN